MPIPRQKKVSDHHNSFKNMWRKSNHDNSDFQMENLTLPTPPRSPNSKSFYSNSIPDPILDDLFQLLEDDQQDEENYSRKRKISEISLTTDAAEITLDNALLELGFAQEHSESPESDASYLIDHLLNSYHTSSLNNYESPPPTNPPSPVHHPDYDENMWIKPEPHSSAASSIGYETDSDSYTDDLLKDFESFDTFEKLASNSNKESVDNFIGQMYEELLDKEPPKRVKFDSESNDEILLKNADCMWNAPLFFDQTELVQEECVSSTNIINGYELEYLRSACVNDHSYAAIEKTDVKPNLHQIINFDKIQKKTKILVPLKHLMETLQQKSYLVSPLGPGKKVIRLTGTGETVKGVFQSSAILTMPTTTKPSNHNVRKRPHNPILNTRYTSPKLMEQPAAASPSPIPTTSEPPITKKKTKAHNNMERMRRIDLRNSFDNLKKLVPILAKSPKCSKVEILKKAEEYIRNLRICEKKLVKEEQAQKFKLQQLKLKLENQ